MNNQNVHEILLYTYNKFIDNSYVVYFDQGYGAAHPTCSSKPAFSLFFAPKIKSRKFLLQLFIKIFYQFSRVLNQRFCIKIWQNHAKNMKKADLDQRLKCAAPKCWSKYTPIYVDISNYSRVIELDFLTSDSSISLKYFFHICLCHLKSVQISNKNS